MKWIKLEETKVSITVRLMEDREEMERKTFESVVSPKYVTRAAEYAVELCYKANAAITWEMRLFFEEYDIDISDLIVQIVGRCGVTVDDDDDDDGVTLDGDDDLSSYDNEMDRLAGLPVKSDTCYHLEGIVGTNENNTIEINKMFAENADLVMCIESLKMLFPFVSVHVSEMKIENVYFVDKR